MGRKKAAEPEPAAPLIRDRIKDFRRVRAGDLVPSPLNFRTHPAEQRAALKAVMSEIGFAGAALVRELPDGRLELIDGHARAEDNPDMEIPVLVTDLDEAEAKVILGSFDHISTMAEIDTGKLDELLREINVSSPELQEMFADFSKDQGLYATPEVIEDVVPEPPAVPITQSGDMWILGRHRLYCGDSTKAEDVARVIGGERAFIMVTDPPYGVEYDADWRADIADRWGGDRTGDVVADDRVDWTESYKLFNGCVAYVWHAGRFTADLVVNLKDAGLSIRSQIIWKKPIFALSRGHYHWQHEPCWYAVREATSAKWCGDRTQSTIWEIAGNHAMAKSKDPADAKTNHGTQKPVECMARPIRNHGGPDDHVYDPFLGSGTTLIAAEQLNRRCFGIEISLAYCDVICTRWANLTGQTPERIPAECVNQESQPVPTPKKKAKSKVSA